MLALSAAPAAAVPPGWLTAPGGANSNALGFCLSQVAQDPEGPPARLALASLSKGLPLRALALCRARSPMLATQPVVVPGPGSRHTAQAARRHEQPGPGW
jgi:hypothetical protein